MTCPLGYMLPHLIHINTAWPASPLGLVLIYLCNPNEWYNVYVNPYILAQNKEKYEVAICKASWHRFTCGLMSNIVICKQRKEYVTHDTKCPSWDQVSLTIETSSQVFLIHFLYRLERDKGCTLLKFELKMKRGTLCFIWLAGTNIQYVSKRGRPYLTSYYAPHLVCHTSSFHVGLSSF